MPLIQSAIIIALSVAVFMAATGGLAQQQLSHLAGILGARYSLLLAAIATCCASMALHGWAGWWIAASLPAAWHGVVAAGALFIAAIRRLRVPHLPAPREPTRSLGAMSLALFLRQLGDPSGWIVMAAAIYGLPVLVVAGAGAIGGIAALLVPVAVRRA